MAIDENKTEVTTPNPMDQHGEQSLLLVKPHATYLGVDGEVRVMLERNRFWILSTERVVLTEEAVKQFLTEISGGGFLHQEVESFVGSCVYFIIAKDEAVEHLRKLCGNDDPEVARLGALHRMYGIDRFANGLWAPKNKKEFASAFGVLRTWRDLYFSAIKNGSEDALGAADMYVKRITGQPEEADGQATVDVEGTVAPEQGE